MSQIGLPTQSPLAQRKTLKDYLLSPSAIEALSGVALRIISPDRAAHLLWDACQKNPLLLEASPASLISACKKLLIQGGEPDGVHGHLVPFKDKKTDTITITAIPTARAFMRAGRAAGLKAIFTGIVYEGDPFYWGTRNGTFTCDHEEPLTRPDTAVPVCYYCLWKDSHDNLHGERMSVKEINAIRDRSNAWQAYIKYQKTCPWVTDYDQMALKTVIKRAAKQWDMPTEFTQAVQEADDREFNSTTSSPEMRNVTPIRTVKSTLIPPTTMPEDTLPEPEEKQAQIAE